MSRLVEIAQRLLSLSEVGIQYAANDYDLDRSQQIREQALELLALGSNNRLEDLTTVVALSEGYPTPKVDVRAVVFDEHGRLLFVRERADGLWALPGGWADPGYTPRETAEKECREEAGLQVEADELWAVLDKKGWGHPVPLYATYKLFIHCLYQGGEPQAGYEVHEARFFETDSIPDLSIERNTQAQIEYLIERRGQPGKPTLFN